MTRRTTVRVLSLPPAFTVGRWLDRGPRATWAEVADGWWRSRLGAGSGLLFNLSPITGPTSNRKCPGHGGAKSCHASLSSSRILPCHSRACPHSVRPRLTVKYLPATDGAGVPGD